MVSLPRSQRPYKGWRLIIMHRGELAFVSTGIGVTWSVSRRQGLLLLALVDAGGRLPKRQATRAMRQGYEGTLTASMRASSARSITRLGDYVAREGGEIVLTEKGEKFVADFREELTRITDPLAMVQWIKSAPSFER